MAYFLKKSRNKKGLYLQIYESHWDPQRGHTAQSSVRALGYEHERYTGRYKIVTPNKERVALFAHQGFGIAFLSCLLDIPYPQFCTRFDICHTGMTTIDFCEYGDFAVPKVLVHSSDAHLYKEGLPTKYNYGKTF